jgi:hypothetical protein
MVKIDSEIIKINPDPITQGNGFNLNNLLSQENQKFILEVINGINELLKNRMALTNNVGYNMEKTPIREQVNRVEDRTIKNAQETPTVNVNEPQQPLNEKDILNDLINGLNDLIKFLGENCTLGQLKKMVEDNPDQVITILKMKGIIK